MRSFKKAQSAMEYLMTYGWAILIIAVVLGALFALNVFNQGGGSSCVALSGYLCSAAVWAHTSGNIVVTLGQTTGVNWGSTNVFYVPQGTPSGVSVAGVPGYPNGDNSLVLGNTQNEIAVLAGGFLSGQTVTVNIPVVYSINGMALSCGSAGCAVGKGNTGGTITTGTVTSGAIWAEYVLNGNTYYVQVATVNLKAS